jgi:diketogulonate reductase-like aldo/keto reductase
MDNVILNNGCEMPVLGMGTYPLKGLKLALLVRKAVKLGYRSFDLAPAYGNEKWFGRGLKFCGIKRDECFITTKLSNRDQREQDIRLAFKASLTRLGLKYLDLYLMHWPVPNLYLSSWKQMEILYREGLVRSIGVCNFHEHHLKHLLDNSDIVPAVNQIELHPLLSQRNILSFCNGRDIQVEAYTPVARMHEKLIKDERLVSIAKQYKKTVPQVVLRWDFQHGLVSIPKTSSPVRLKENISIFDFNLTDKEMDVLDLLNVDFRVRYDPDNCDFSML